MPGPSSFDRKVYGAMEKTDYIPDEFKTWMPRYLRYLSALQVNKTQIPGITGEKWHNIGAAGEPPFQNGWVNYGGTFQVAAFYKDYLGTVHLTGLIKNGTLGQIGFTLPAGYRPAAYLYFPTLSNGILGGCRVAANGDVIIGSEGSNAWMSLDPINFRAA
jgi:hypothetical protein